MPIHVALHHRTTYAYDRPVSLGPQTIRLRPAPHARTRILGYSLRVEPGDHFINWQQDPQSNYLARLVFHGKATKLEVEVDLVAEMAVFNPFDFFLEPEAERFPFAYDESLEHDLSPFLLRGDSTPALESYWSAALHDLRVPLETERRSGGRALAAPSMLGAGVPSLAATGGPAQLVAELEPETRVRTIDFLVGLNRRLWADLKYVIRMEPGVQSAEETLRLRSGSCRDSAWLLVQLLRRSGLAARFVSGYLIQLAPDVKSIDGPSGPEVDFTDLHAWCEVYLPGAGWIGLDPTSGLLAGEGHIPLAATPDPQGSAPIAGLVSECDAEMSVVMTVTRLLESPRVTRPYTEEAWAEIESLGHRVDADLKAADCRLTMGGEPTFVSVDDMDGAEWNTAALGPTKRALAGDLLWRLKRRFTRGAILHYGQGKQYPGEPLPRWALAAYWRKDGEPVWTDESLLALEASDYGHDARRAEEFIHALSHRLGCGARWILPAFEDVWYHLWKERRLPTNVDPFDSRLSNEEDRARLARVFERGLEKVVGYALPLHREAGPGGPAWASGPWFLRSERCYLLPGDSPMGFRLPLDSVPWASATDVPWIGERDPFEPRTALPPRAPAERRQLFRRPIAGPPGDSSAAVPGAPARGESAGWIVRTALCVEPRQGRIHVFFPPLRALEDYLDFAAAVEDTARSLETPVVIEGYPPPQDPRIHAMKVTPDSGVIEVNVHPSEAWDDVVERTEGLYEEARLARLGTEKFMLDGRHAGTGGGNHIVLGGATPQDSPFLRRPDLLRSLLAYWQNHPSLSFLFSGLFLGPTSQSPRIDEARNDSLRELELAFRQVPDHGVVRPWLVDRIFRNLLVDATGNTHRAEFCIDKLFPPESAAGRQGLLEMRAFEMPPHARMSLAQQLLLRTLVARFWREPYTQRLVRWGTDIHDRWMLPHFVWSDFCDVIDDVRRHGYALNSDWFAPHFEFRFPRHGDLDVKNVHLEVRHALEPWHVLGEEAGLGGAARYVDSSLERLEVKVQGLTDSRHAVAVRGWALPLHPTGTNGERVCGVRYRAWQPPSCLHPTIGVHTPLTFDVVDTWNGRAIGGCTYHVMHPGGRNYETFPVNAYEAESRRLARFFRQGHTPGPVSVRRAEQDPELPFTFDLRRV